MIDPPTPAGFVQDAEEALGRARAMRDQAERDMAEWADRVFDAYVYLGEIRAWAAAGGTGPRPKKPKEPT